MSEEIDIIELLKRVKEGKEPKVIAINGDKYNYFEDWITLDEIYYTTAHGEVENLCYWEMDFMTEIKILDKPILDKPIIEELNENENVDIYELARKVNQIIKHINKEEK